MRRLTILVMVLCTMVSVETDVSTAEKENPPQEYDDPHDDPNYRPFDDLTTPEHASYAPEGEEVEELYCSEVIGYFPGYYCSQERYFGRGGNGITFIVSDENGKEYMLKIEEEQSWRGINGLKEVQGHENIIKLIVSEEIGKHTAQIIEFAEFGNLKSYQLDNEHLFANDTYTLSMFGQIINGVEHIHSRNVVHADIKPQNIVVNKDHIAKIIDFDLCVFWDEQKGGRGTNSYMAPEVFAVWSKDQMYYDGKVDVYALTVTLYYLFNSQNYPFHADDDDAVYALMEKRTFLARQGSRLDLAKIYERGLMWAQSERADLQEFKRLVQSATPFRENATMLQYDETVATVGANFFFEDMDPIACVSNEIVSTLRSLVCALCVMMAFAVVTKNPTFKLLLRRPSFDKAGIHKLI